MQGWLSDAMKARQEELIRAVSKKAQPEKRRAEYNRLVRLWRAATGQTDPRRKW